MRVPDAGQVGVQAQYYPHLRYSFTLATLAASDGSHGCLNTYGEWTMDAIKSSGLANYTINLMCMDYGSPSPGVCVVQVRMPQWRSYEYLFAPAAERPVRDVALGDPGRQERQRLLRRAV